MPWGWVTARGAPGQGIESRRGSCLLTGLHWSGLAEHLMVPPSPGLLGRGPGSWHSLGLKF